MKEQYRYVNRNPFPIYLPNKRGGQILIRPGDGTTESWFSRFIGRGQLTREKIEGPKNRPIIKSVYNQAPDIIQVFKDEETKDYIYRKGIYRCKKCDIFRTGSLASLQTHIREYHGEADSVVISNDPTKVTAPPIEETVTKTLPRTEIESPNVVKETKTNISESENIETLITQDSSVKTEPIVSEKVEDSDVFTCDEPGCGKSFTSQRGLDMHKRRIHKN